MRVDAWLSLPCASVSVRRGIKKNISPVLSTQLDDFSVYKPLLCM